MFIVLKDVDLDKNRIIRIEHIFECEEVDGGFVRVWLALEVYGSSNSFLTHHTVNEIMEKLGLHNKR